MGVVFSVCVLPKALEYFHFQFYHPIGNLLICVNALLNPIIYLGCVAMQKSVFCCVVLRRFGIRSCRITPKRKDFVEDEVLINV